MPSLDKKNVTYAWLVCSMQQTIERFANVLKVAIIHALLGNIADAPERNASVLIFFTANFNTFLCKQRALPNLVSVTLELRRAIISAILRLKIFCVNAISVSGVGKARCERKRVR